MKARTSRAPAPGESRICPHCKATILKSAVSCPICQHALRFAAPGGIAPQPYHVTCPLSVQGTIRHHGEQEALEYAILVEVHDEAGRLISRQSVGVGALSRSEERTFSLKVEVSVPLAPV
ncbi:MAG TPA: hypothetical protein VNN77_04645 [candidate division Zixibacteria bacterium]|nr:hypothetical protein [candidate division Zixibacteria bacterium]